MNKLALSVFLSLTSFSPLLSAPEPLDRVQLEIDVKKKNGAKTYSIVGTGKLEFSFGASKKPTKPSVEFYTSIFCSVPVAIVSSGNIREFEKSISESLGKNPAGKLFTGKKVRHSYRTSFVKIVDEKVTSLSEGTLKSFEGVYSLKTIPATAGEVPSKLFTNPNGMAFGPGSAEKIGQDASLTLKLDTSKIQENVMCQKLAKDGFSMTGK